jgi:tyrosinase
MATKKPTAKPPAKGGTAAVPYGKASKKHVSPKISLEPLGKKFYRADLIFDGVDHSGASFEARVFLNNPAANEKTAKTPKNGYAGTFHIFGHGGCFGDVGHCEVRGLPRQYDPRPAHPLTLARKLVIATDAIRQAVSRGKQITVTVVPIIRAGTSRCDYDNVLKYDKISIVTYK